MSDITEQHAQPLGQPGRIVAGINSNQWLYWWEERVARAAEGCGIAPGR
jgi:hypothetical protein